MIRNAALRATALTGLALAICLPIGSSRSRADVTMPSIFGSHMVLQRDQEDKVWGWAEPGEEIKVEIAVQAKTTKADDEGNWSVQLDPMPAGGPHTLTVKGKNTLSFEDVLVGEVWLCSGQSNMEWPVGRSDDPDLEILTANFPQIRLISVPRVGTQEPQKDFEGKWELCSPETVKDFSAVGFFFGRRLHQALDVPIGLIDDAWGGSAAEAWVRRDILEQDPKYQDLLASWKEREARYEEVKDEDSQESKSLANQMRGNARPGNIYNGVLKPTIGYGIRGAIWYQGESNADRAYQYRDLFPLMIQSWREEWGIGDFPFYWVQLADFLAEQPLPTESAWAELREAQTMTLDRLPNTGQAVIIDLGEGRDIHPRNKQGVANRLVRWALAKDYGIEVPHQSPTYKSLETRGNIVTVTFDHVGEGGLYAFDTPEVLGFTLAGEDEFFHPAQAKIVAPNQVEVWSDEVAKPVAVRYGWADNPVVNLYDRNGLPVTPFRTDDWPGLTAGATR